MGTMGSPRTLRWWSSQALLKPWGPEIRDAGCLGFVSKPGVGAPSVDLRKARWRRRETAGGGGGEVGERSPRSPGEACSHLRGCAR